MAIFRLEWNEPAPETCRGGVLSIGNFDGVHRGHASLLARLQVRAGERGVPAVALTFDPHPLLLLRPEAYEPTLTTVEDRAHCLQRVGADHVVVLNTRPELLRLSAEEFFQKVIRENLRGCGMVEGPNFGFGKNREGNVETLARLCGRDGMSLEIVPPLHMDGGVVSSSRIRKALVAGDLADANRWLGRPYALSGRVAEGQRRGRQLGFPTANLIDVPTIIPGDGVYAVRAKLADQSWPGAANVGPNPTFDEQARKLEVHLIGFEGDLYGRNLNVEFHARLRDTRRFESVAELLAQVREDVRRATDVLSPR
jgi:riboflavin kinase/FMN adenylyltransferase